MNVKEFTAGVGMIPQEKDIEIIRSAMEERGFPVEPERDCFLITDKYRRWGMRLGVLWSVFAENVSDFVISPDEFSDSNLCGSGVPLCDLLSISQLPGEQIIIPASCAAGLDTFTLRSYKAKIDSRKILYRETGVAVKFFRPACDAALLIQLAEMVSNCRFRILRSNRFGFTVPDAAKENAVTNLHYVKFDIYTEEYLDCGKYFSGVLPPGSYSFADGFAPPECDENESVGTVGWLDLSGSCKYLTKTE